MWMWMFTIIVLIGAELNSEIEHQIAQDSTGDGGKPMVTRGAHAADTAGQSEDIQPPALQAEDIKYNL